MKRYYGEFTTKASSFQISVEARDLNQAMVDIMYKAYTWHKIKPEEIKSVLFRDR